MKVNNASIAGKITHSLTRKNNKFLLALADLNNLGIRAKAGIRGEKALIMGVNNFGDPLHTFPNTGRRDAIRKTGKKLGAEGLTALGVELNPIPARPFFSDASYNNGGEAKSNIDAYLEKHVPRLISASVTGTFKKGGKRTETPKEFYEGLSEVMADNIRRNWNNSTALYEENSEATIKHKGNLPPLHGGHFSEDGIEGWVK